MIPIYLFKQIDLELNRPQSCWNTFKQQKATAMTGKIIYSEESQRSATRFVLDPNFQSSLKLSKPLGSSEKEIVARISDLLHHKDDKISTLPIYYNLFDKPILDMVIAETILGATSASFSRKLDQKGIDPTVTTALQNWRQDKKVKWEALEQDTDSLESQLFPQNSTSADELSPYFLKAKIFLHLLFFSTRKASNANVHRLSFYKRSLRTSYDKECPCKKPLIDLLGQFSTTDQWYFEMSTGASLTTALTSTLLSAKHRMLINSINATEADVMQFLQLFRREIIECPAPYWRIVFLNRFLLTLIKDGKLKSLSETLANYHFQAHGENKGAVKKIKDNFRKEMENYTATIGFTPNNLNQVIIFKSVQEFSDQVLRNILPIGDQSIEDAQIEHNIKLLVESAKERIRTFGVFQHFASFPSEYCADSLSNIDPIIQCKKTGAEEKIFQEIHTILYPNGYEIPIFKDLDKLGS